MKSVYLDQNKWIDLSHAYHGESSGQLYEPALKAVTKAVTDGTAIFPLSAGHYFETWKHYKQGRRRALGEVMAEFSRCRTIGDQRTITKAEIEKALQQQFGRPERPETIEVFGYGVAYAFGQPALADYKEIAENNPRFAGLDNVIEREMISGPPADLPVAGIAQPNLQAAAAYADGENELAAAFIKEGTSREQQERTIAWQELSSLLPLIVPALRRAHVSEAEFFALGADGLTDFMFSMPWRGAVLSVRQRRHREPQQPWKQNDLADISYLSLGLTYCDILVAEKQWVSRMRAAKLNERYGTVVIADLRELPDHL